MTTVWDLLENEYSSDKQNCTKSPINGKEGKNADSDVEEQIEEHEDNVVEVSDVEKQIEEHEDNVVDKPKKRKKIVKPVKPVNYEPIGKIIIYITKSGAFIKFDYLSDLEYLKKINRYFTLEYRDNMSPVVFRRKCCSIYKSKNRIIVPRFGVFEIMNNAFGLVDCTTKSQITSGLDIETEIKWCGKLNENQQLISAHIMNNYFTKHRVLKGSAGCILNLEAGQGKSYLAAYLISVIKKKTAIVLHSRSLLLQWYKVLVNTFGDSVSVGYYYSDKKKIGDIMLMIINSAASDMFRLDDTELDPLDFYNQFGFIVFDECHLYSSKMAQKVFKIAHAPYMLGLSATPDEHVKGFDKAVWWQLGPVIDAKTIDGYQSASENFTAVIHRVMYYGPPSHTKRLISNVTQTTMLAPTINMICDDLIRSNMVVQCIKDGLDKGLFMFVFADRRLYLTRLKILLKKKLNIDSAIVDNDKEFTRIVGGATDADLEQAELNARVIFTTYQYMGTGKSVIKMNGLVMATPRKSKMKQYINRIFRLGSDATIQRHIWDICDMRTNLSNQWSTRKIYYDDKNYKIVKSDVRYEDYLDIVDFYDKDINNAVDIKTKKSTAEKTKKTTAVKTKKTTKVKLIANIDSEDPNDQDIDAEDQDHDVDPDDQDIDQDELNDENIDELADDVVVKTLNDIFEKTDKKVAVAKKATLNITKVKDSNKNLEDENKKLEDENKNLEDSNVINIKRQVKISKSIFNKLSE
jgi:hypothetical protein